MAPTITTYLSRISLNKGIFRPNTTTVSRLSSVRPLVLSSQREARSQTPPEEQKQQEPIKFSTSKASHRTWKVDRSMGSHFERPWRKVLPLSLFCTVFLLWCALRGYSDVDEQLDKPLHETVATLLPDEDKPDKPS